MLRLALLVLSAGGAAALPTRRMAGTPLAAALESVDDDLATLIEMERATQENTARGSPHEAAVSMNDEVFRQRGAQQVQVLNEQDSFKKQAAEEGSKFVLKVVNACKQPHKGGEKCEATNEAVGAYQRMSSGVEHMINQVHLALHKTVKAEGGNLDGSCFRKKSVTSAARKFSSNEPKKSKKDERAAWDKMVKETAFEARDGFEATNGAMLREAFCASDIMRFTASIGPKDKGKPPDNGQYTRAVKAIRGEDASPLKIQLRQSCVYPEKKDLFEEAVDGEDGKCKNLPPKCKAWPAFDEEWLRPPRDIRDPCQLVWGQLPFCHKWSGEVEMRPYKTKNYWKKQKKDLPENEPLAQYAGINDVGYVEVPLSAGLFALSQDEITFLKKVDCKNAKQPVVTGARCDTTGAKTECAVKCTDDACTDGALRVRIELQFNTPLQMAVKETAHVDYEVYRLIAADSWKSNVAARAALYRVMSAKYDDVVRPPGAAWGVTGPSKVTLEGKVEFTADGDFLATPKQHDVPFVIDRGEELNEAAFTGILQELEAKVKAVEDGASPLAYKEYFDKVVQAVNDAGQWLDTKYRDEQLLDMYVSKKNDEVREKVCKMVLKDPDLDDPDESKIQSDLIKAYTDVAVYTKKVIALFNRPKMKQYTDTVKKLLDLAVADHEKKELFDAADTNRDGEVSKPELDKLTAQLKTVADIPDEMQFSDYDKDNDGKVTRQEWGIQVDARTGKIMIEEPIDYSTALRSIDWQYFM